LCTIKKKRTAGEFGNIASSFNPTSSKHYGGVPKEGEQSTTEENPAPCTQTGNVSSGQNPFVAQVSRSQTTREGGSARVLQKAKPAGRFTKEKEVGAVTSRKMAKISGS